MSIYILLFHFLVINFHKNLIKQLINPDVWKHPDFSIPSGLLFRICDKLLLYIKWKDASFKKRLADSMYDYAVSSYQSRWSSPYTCHESGTGPVKDECPSSSVLLKFLQKSEESDFHISLRFWTAYSIFLPGSPPPEATFSGYCAPEFSFHPER